MIQIHLLWLAKEVLVEKKYDLWAELLMKGGMPTPTLPRRLRDLVSDEKMQTAAQDQILFEGFCHLMDSMDNFDNLATLLKAAVAQQSELPTCVADDVRALSEVVTVTVRWQYSVLHMGRGASQNKASGHRSVHATVLPAALGSCCDGSSGQCIRTFEEERHVDRSSVASADRSGRRLVDYSLCIRQHG